jgi:hypothetical protein
MGLGPIGANCYRSKLHLTWVARAVSNYGSLGKSEVGTVSDGASGGTASGGTSYHPSDRSGRCYYASSDGRGRRGFGGPLYEVRKTKVFSPLKHERICCACGLYPANYDAGRPPIYAVFLAEGRLMVKVEALLQNFLAPAPNDWDPSVSIRRKNSCAT